MECNLAQDGKLDDHRMKRSGYLTKENGFLQILMALVRHTFRSVNRIFSFNEHSHFYSFLRESFRWKYVVLIKTYGIENQIRLDWKSKSRIQVPQMQDYFNKLVSK